MFIGHYYHTIEAKGRLAIPQAFRSKLSSGGVITAGLDGCLFLLPKTYWQQLCEKLSALPLTNKIGRQFTRLLVQSATQLEMDSQGRTLIPDYLKEKASLKKNVVVAGALTRIEIWDRERYHQHLNFITAQNPNFENDLNDLNI
jgi:MraZ protein